MGVKNLWDILESCKKTLPLHHLHNKRLCIDLSCWMVQLQSVSKSHSYLKDKVYLQGLFHRLRALLSLNCNLIFVTDGSIPAIKIATYRRRLNSANEVNEANSKTLSSLRRNMGSEFSCLIKEAKVLGLALGIPCLDGIEEAEAQCALLNSESLCDGCFSSDSDVFLFGARTVYRDICLGDGGYVICYEMEDIERQLGFGRNSLISLALLLGCDYSHGVHGLGRESACQIVKSIGNNVVLQRIASEGLSFAKKKKGPKKQAQNSKYSKENLLDHEKNMKGKEISCQRDDHCQQVINAFLQPKCHPADSEAVRRVLVQQPFELAKVQQICSQLFEWPPEKTDEYILPKMAERDLRQFANLRSSSSDLGVQLPLHMNPIKCPVSGIIKPRKNQGKECYEVSWENLHGLISIVPADLLKSACPEKIVEFEESKAQAKKQNGRKARQKKSSDSCYVNEVEKRLQNLLLDIESGSNTFGFPLASREVIARNCMVASNINPLASREVIARNCMVASNINPNTGPFFESCYEDGPSDAKYEIIDLLSPSPLRHKHLQSKDQNVNAHHHIDVIELSE